MSGQHTNSLLNALRARGSGVLAQLVTQPGPPPGIQGIIAPADVPAADLLQQPAAEALAATVAGPARSRLEGAELEPMKVDLPLYAQPLPTLLDPRLPAKKMPRFTEFDRSSEPPRQFEPLLLSEHLPGSAHFEQRCFVEAR
jgi:hypothetical protein